MKLTYILGAGASAGKIPTVEKLRDAAYSMTSWSSENKFMKDCMMSLANVMDEWNTPDTFARALTINREYDRLHILRRAVSLFFSTYKLYEQQGVRDNEGMDVLDKRYLPWIGSIADANNEYLIPDNINVLTYNYDLQLERALYQFATSVADEFLDWGLPVYPNINRSKGLDYNQCRIYHLNGISGFLRGELGEPFMVAPFYSHRSGNPKEWLSQFHRDVEILERRNASDFAPFLKFAWENLENKELISSLEQIMSDTTHLVIIGYSFPNFNRKFDLTLISSCSNKLREIVVVDPQFKVDYLFDMFKNLVDISRRLDFLAERGQIVTPFKSITIDRKDHFYIPPEYHAT